MRVARGFFFILVRSAAARRVAPRPHIEVESGTTRAVRPSSDATRRARDAGRARDDADASRAPRRRDDATTRDARQPRRERFDAIEPSED